MADLHRLGYTRLVLKSDGEPAILALKAEVKKKANIDIITEEPAVGESQSNGEIENAVFHVQSQVRTLKSAVESRYQKELHSRHPVLAWAIQYAGVLLTRFMTGVDGKTAWEREKGKPYRRELPEFGECVHYMPLKRGKKLKLEPRFRDGVFLGIREDGDEMMIGTPDGVIRSDTETQKPDSMKWDAVQLDGVIGLPWKPVPGSEVMTVPAHILPPEARQEILPTVSAAPHVYVPKSVYLRKAEFDKCGYTYGCRGCDALQEGRSRVAHSDECRTRITTAMAQDDDSRKRVEEAKSREDRYLTMEIERVDKKRRLPEVADEPMGAENPQPPGPPDVQEGAAMEVQTAGGDPNAARTVVTGELPAPVGMDLNSLRCAISHLEESLISECSQMKRAALLSLGAVSVAEVYSPPRVTSKATNFGLSPDFALDLTILDFDDGMPWDFSSPAKREKAKLMVERDKPYLSIGSPQCTPFSNLQNLNYPKMAPEKVDQMIRNGIAHLEFCVELYLLQLNAGRYFLHEHPDSTSSWQLKCTEALVADPRVIKIKGDMCRQLMTSVDIDGETGLAKRTTGWATNSPCIAARVRLRCSDTSEGLDTWVRVDSKPSCMVLPNRGGPRWDLVTRRVTMDADSGAVLQDLRNPQTATRDELLAPVRRCKLMQTTFFFGRGGTPCHRHVQLDGKAAQVYPDELVNNILSGIKEQMQSDNMLGAFDAGPVNQEVDFSA